MKYRFTILPSHIEKAKNMSFEKKIDELCCPNYMGDRKVEIPTGSAFFHAEERDLLKKRIDHYKSVAGSQSIITTDMENGPGEMVIGGTEFPELYGTAQAGDLDDVERMGKAAALEGREVGFNWTLGPCVDIVHNPDSPAVGARSAGRTPEDVIATTKAYIRGLQGNGMVATAKHFPGDGFGIYDQHLTTPENPLSMEEWHQKSGRVFREVIEDGVMAIMPGHISLPAYDSPNPKNGVYPPATLSARLMKDLLRGELGFEGIIVSDAVGMGGIVGYMNVFDACATFLEAGGDILLFPRIGKKFYEEMKRCVEKGILSEETLVDRTARVLAFKDDLKSRGFFEAPKLYNREFHEVLAEKMTVNAMQIIRDRNEIIPTVTQRAQSVLHVIIKNEMVKNLNHVQRLTDELTSRYDIVREITNPGPDYLFDLAENKEYDLIVCSVVANYNFGTNVIRLNSGACRNLMQGWMHLNTPVVFISHNHPFIEEEYKAVMDTVINTYGSTRYTADAICELIKPSHSVSQKNENIECSCSH